MVPCPNSHRESKLMIMDHSLGLVWLCLGQVTKHRIPGTAALLQLVSIGHISVGRTQRDGKHLRRRGRNSHGTSVWVVLRVFCKTQVYAEERAHPSTPHPLDVLKTAFEGSLDADRGGFLDQREKQCTSSDTGAGPVGRLNFAGGRGFYDCDRDFSGAPELLNNVEMVAMVEKGLGEATLALTLWS